MNIIFRLVSRNMKNYLRDKASVFFSFLSVFIIIGLYAFFLGDMQVQNIKQGVGDIAGIDFLVNSWIIAGLLCVSAITVPLAILGFFVEDSIKKITEDFYATPVKRYQIVLGYIASSWVVGIMVVMFTLLLGEAFIVLKGGELLSLLAFAKVFGLVCVSVISFSGFLFFLITFIKSNTALSLLFTITSTTVGFLAGIYVPLGVLSEGIATVIKLFPVAQSASLLRAVFMERPLSIVFENAPAGFEEEFRISFGVDLVIGGYTLTTAEILLIITAFGVVFYGLSILIVSRRKRK